MANSNQGGGKDNKDSKENTGIKGGNQQSGDTSNRGFASMDPDKQREIASEGGRAAHASGNAHEFSSEEAREAGRMSHKNDGNQQSGSNSGGSGGSGSSGGRASSGSQGGNEQSGSKGNSESGRGGNQSSSGNQGSSGKQGSAGNEGSSGTQGGSREQHAEAGRQSHKNDRKG